MYPPSHTWYILTVFSLCTALVPPWLYRLDSDVLELMGLLQQAAAWSQSLEGSSSSSILLLGNAVDGDGDGSRVMTGDGVGPPPKRTAAAEKWKRVRDDEGSSSDRGGVSSLSLEELLAMAVLTQEMAFEVLASRSSSGAGRL